MRYGQVGSSRYRGRGRPAPPPPPPVIHELTVPDELLAWGKDPQRAHKWAAPWAHEVERLMQRGVDSPLSGLETELFLNRLGALCLEAIRAGESDLLLGIDLLTAEWLGLRYSFETEAGRVTFGEDVSYQELRSMIKSKALPDGVVFALECKRAVSDAFPQAQIGAIISATESEPTTCYGCGRDDSVVMISLDTGSDYCGACWASLTRRPPPREETGSKSKKKRKRG